MALIDLKNMMGISQSSQLTLTDDLTAPAAPPSLDELQTAAIEQRPEIQAARARARSAQSNIGVAKSAYKPQVYATAMADLSVMKGDGMNGATDTGYLVGVAAALPIFDGGLRKSSVDEANAMLQQMRADEREALLAVSKDVAASYTQFTAASKNADLAQAAITQSEEDYRVIRMRYEAGKATNVEVLDSLAALTRARTMYCRSALSTKRRSGTDHPGNRTKITPKDTGGNSLEENSYHYRLPCGFRFLDYAGLRPVRMLRRQIDGNEVCHDQDDTIQARRAQTRGLKKIVSAVCPVMGNKIPDVTKAAGKSVYKGKTYYFCCPGCKPKFDKNPEKYIHKK